MKKILFGILILFGVDLAAQTYTQSADGLSSIVFPGGNIMFNSTATQFSAGINNIYKSYEKKSAFIYGGEIKAKNDEGISILLNGKNFSPEASLVLNIGWSTTNFPNAQTNWEKVKIYRSEKEKIIGKFDTIVFDSIRKHITDPALRKEISDQVEKQDISFATEAKLNPQFKNEKNDSLFSIIIEIARKTYDNSMRMSLSQIETSIENEYQKDSSLISRSPFQSNILFAHCGLLGQSFDYYEKIDTANYYSNFSTEEFTGCRLGITDNYKVANTIIGISIDAVYTNSFKSLSKKTFTIKEESTNSLGQTFIKEKSILAYTGTYSKFWTGEISLDCMINMPISSTTYVTLNPYNRVRFLSDKPDLLPNYITCGLGAYFFKNKGKFLGGIYIEATDITNEYDKLSDDPENEPFYKRLKIGFVINYTFNKIFWQ